jgi:general secretion pathway protein E
MQPLHNIQLVPYEIEGFEVALKNYTLFATYEDEVIVCIGEKRLEISLDYLSKQSYEYEVILLDEVSYEKLYNRFLELHTDKQMASIQSEQQEAVVEDDDDFNVSEFLQTGSDILTSEESAPIIKFVNSLFYQALKKRASDIHIETHEFKSEIRYRIDGVLEKHIELDKNIMALVISRIKVISNLDISEKRIPQDGRTQIKIAKKTLDIRVSVLPTFYGERVVMRILMQSDDIPKLEELGFSLESIEQLESVLQNSYGMVLVTGPTGSGKSTTLHSVLQQIESSERNIITVEDPVEYKSDKINQIQVNAKVGLTFASGLRSILRQDPDVVMVGEIRDTETASIAVQAALTGHLMFSTLHTNRATAAVTRLIDMGIEKFLISSSLLAVLAQRLVRVLCDECKEEDILAENYVLDFNLNNHTKLYKACGCASCNYTGYTKRIAIEELFIMDESIKLALKDEVDDHQLLHLAKKAGMVTLDEQIVKLLKEGRTSVSEAYRIGIK